jgi:hypothetical protein
MEVLKLWPTAAGMTQRKDIKTENFFDVPDRKFKIESLTITKSYNIQTDFMKIGKLFLESVLKRFSDYKKLGERTFEQLSNEEMNLQPNNSSNSIAIIIQHLHGNMLSRWTNFLTEDGEKPWRKRDEEFELQPLTKEQLLALWNEGWKALLETISSLTPDDLSKTVTIRSEPLIVIDAINRQVAHYSYHVGQIVFLGKWMKEEQWQTLSIPKKGSAAFNEKMIGKKHK